MEVPEPHATCESQSEQGTGPTKPKTKVQVGMDVHKDTVMIAVLPEAAREPTLVKQSPHDPKRLRWSLDWLAGDQRGACLLRGEWRGLRAGADERRKLPLGLCSLLC